MRVGLEEQGCSVNGLVPSTDMRVQEEFVMNNPKLGMIFAMAATAGNMAFADQVIVDDLIVQGSACVGLECADGEDFGFDTIRLKGDELRLLFTDTSNSASFPTNDWQITINDLDDGVANRFSIDDIDAGTTPFTIEGGAPTHSLYLQRDGRVGIGTATPNSSAALDVRGDLRVDGNVDVTGGVIGTTGVKAGIIDQSEFDRGEASVTFDTPYAQDYMILLTAVSKRQGKTFKPTITAQDNNGFSVSRGGSARALVEVHWMTQAVGE